MSKYIDADKAEIILEHILETDTRTFFDRGDELTDRVYASVTKGLETLKSLPAADVQEVRHGRWIYRQIPMPLSDGSKECVECSVCHTHWDGEMNHCPNCGAKMDEVDE